MQKVWISHFEEDKSKTGHFQISVNDIPLCNGSGRKCTNGETVWGITTLKQGNGMKN